VADDRTLIAGVAAGDRGSLDALYHRHAGWILTRLSRRCSDRDAVDTALQETFVSVWKQARKYRPTGEVTAWMWTIALRRLIDEMRRRPAPVPVADPTVLTSALTEEIHLALAHTPVGAALAHLEPDLQAVLAATALDGLSNSEAAALLGIPIGTVKSRLSRARAILQEVAP
jgi:RNA polymerase sigma-70 factor (ECF subfamily)